MTKSKTYVKKETKSDWQLMHEEKAYSEMRSEIRDVVAKELQLQFESFFENLLSVLQPQFLAEDFDWIPQCAHEKDAAADIKAWFEEKKDYAWVKDLSAQLTLAAAHDQPVYLNGKKLPAEQILSECTDQLKDTEDDGVFKGLYLAPNSSAIVKTGFKIALPELPDPFTACYRINPRSGLAAKFRISVTNSPGLIDCHYRNDVGVLLENRGEGHHVFSHGARIAQGSYEILIAQSAWSKEQLRALQLNETVRKGGFGHTGV